MKDQLGLNPRPSCCEVTADFGATLLPTLENTCTAVASVLNKVEMQDGIYYSVTFWAVSAAPSSSSLSLSRCVYNPPPPPAPPPPPPHPPFPVFSHQTNLGFISAFTKQQKGKTRWKCGHRFHINAKMGNLSNAHISFSSMNLFGYTTTGCKMWTESCFLCQPLVSER